MTQRKFVLTKQTRKNGNYYYTCSVEVKLFIRYRNILEFLKYGWGYKVPYYKEYYLNENGFGYNDEYFFYEREHALKAIDKYIERKEEEYGEKVISTETEIIYK